MTEHIGSSDVMGPAKLPIDFNVFERFATSELTHSGIWGWILQSLDPDCPEELHELRAPARALLKRLNVQLDGRISVQREVKLHGSAGRVDIEVTDQNSRVVVIETKVKAAPDVAQRERYAAAYRAAQRAQNTPRRLIAITILSTTFDEPLDRTDIGYIGAAEILDILHAGRYQGQLINQYTTWLDYTLKTRKANVDKALGRDPIVARDALRDGAAQWGVMRSVRDQLGGQAAASLYCGRNLDGSAWTQVAFTSGCTSDCDQLFYRLESRGDAAEFTLRQYGKPITPGKADRLDRLRQWFREAMMASGCPANYFDTTPRYARRDVQEAKVAQVTIPSATAADLLERLPSVHAAFARRLGDEGWPLGPA